VKAQVKLVAQAYLKSTPIRFFPRDRNVVSYFGKQRANPTDLETVGYQPKPKRATEPEGKIAPRR
jgi:hypothetical protein